MSMRVHDLTESNLETVRLLIHQSNITKSLNSTCSRFLQHLDELLNSLFSFKTTQAMKQHYNLRIAMQASARNLLSKEKIIPITKVQ